MFNDGGRSTTFMALLCPQDILADWHDHAWINIYLQGQSVVKPFKAPRKHGNGVEFNELLPGHMLTVNIAIGKENTDAVIQDLDARTRWVKNLSIPSLTQ